MSRAHPTAAWVVPAIIIAGTSVTAAGCAASGISTAHGGPTASPTPRTTATALPKASCGNAVTHGLNARTEILSAGKTALTCFSAAARACQKGSLEVTEMGTDTGTQHVFAVTAQGEPCQVTELSQDYSANFGGSTGPVSSTGCRVTVATKAGVTLTCAGQELLIPVRITAFS